MVTLCSYLCYMAAIKVHSRHSAHRQAIRLLRSSVSKAQVKSMGCLVLCTDTHLIAFYFDNSLFFSELTRRAMRKNMELKTILYPALLMNVKPFQKNGEICYTYLNTLNAISLQFYLFKTLFKLTNQELFFNFCHKFSFLFKIRYSYKIWVESQKRRSNMKGLLVDKIIILKQILILLSTNFF